MIAYSKKNNKVRLYTTFTDEYYTDWIPVEEGLKIIIKEKRWQFKRDIEELTKSFPDGYTDPRNYKRIWRNKLINNLNK